MAMVDVDSISHLSVDSQPKSVGLVWELAATRHSVCIHQMNWVNCHNAFDHDDSTINISIGIIIIFWTPVLSSQGRKKLCYARKMSSWNGHYSSSSFTKLLWSRMALKC